MVTNVIKLVDATSPDAIKIWADKIYAAIKDMETRIGQPVNGGGGGPATPTGPAGGVLGGTYPDPSFAVDMATQTELNALAASAMLTGAVAGGDLSGTYPDPSVVKVHMGATALSIGAIADTQILKRSGSTIIGQSVGSFGGGVSLYPAFTVPAVSDFTWVNQGSATAIDLFGSRGVHVYAPSNGTVQNVRMFSRALPAASNYHVDVGIMPLQFLTQYSLVLFGLYDSVSGKFVAFEFSNAGGQQSIYYRQWSAPGASSPDGTYFGPNASDMMPWSFPFLRFEDDGTNRILSWANDGENYMPIHSITRTHYMTPNRAFIGLNPFDQVAGVTIKHWFQG